VRAPAAEARITPRAQYEIVPDERPLTTLDPGAVEPVNVKLPLAPR
jgi:hypothetical protein